MNARIRLVATAGVLLCLLISETYANPGTRVVHPLQAQCVDGEESCAKRALVAATPETSELRWELDSREETRQRKFFRYRPVWNGTPVHGATAVVTTNREGQPLFVDRPFSVFQVEMRPQPISPEKAKSIALDHVHEHSGGTIPVDASKAPERVVLADGNVGRLVYEVKVGVPPAGVVHVFVDQDSGKIVWVKNPVIH